MEIYDLTSNVKVFGVQVKTFPDGIGEVFESLKKMLPPGDERSYYGISEFSKGNMIYRAAAVETFDGEAEKYGCEKYTIKKGKYLTETIKNWPDKTACIKDVFHKMIQDDRADKTKPCVEWYKNMDEMLCMVKIDKTKP